MAIPPEIISSIKDRISLVELIGESVQLKQSGRNHLGLCPFHQEKTPSFNVKDEEGYYHCFGCGAHGSAFDFVMNTRGLTFPEAAQFLANRIGIKIPSSGDWGDREKIKKENERLNLLREVMAQSAWVYANALFKEEYGEVARNYLKKRGITG